MKDKRWSEVEEKMLYDALAGEAEALEGLRASTNADLRAEFDQLREFAATLDSAGEESRAEIADALDAPPTAEDLAQVEAFLSEALRPPKKKPSPVLWLAAAVILLSVGIVFRDSLFGGPGGVGPGPKTGPGTTYLNPGADQLLEPIGKGRKFNRFAWKKGVEPGETYVVRVYDGETPPDELPDAILESPRIKGKNWVLDAMEQRKLEALDHIRWELVLLDAHLEETLIESGEAWRRP